MEFKGLKDFIQKDLLYLPQDFNLPEDENLISLGLDSLKIFRLVVFIEENYHLKIPPETISPISMSSINLIIQLLQKVLK